MRQYVEGRTVGYPDSVTPGDLRFFRAFGCHRLQGLASKQVISALCAEFDKEFTTAFGDLSRSLGTDGFDGLFLPLMTYRTPTSLSLLEGLAPVAAALLDRPVLPVYAEGSVFFGATPWHLDSGHAPKSIKLALYLEALDAETGAFRFAPGSHHTDYRQEFAAYLRSVQQSDSASVVRSILETPAYLLPTVPGDLITIDQHAWHATAGGRARRQWAVSYIVAPRTRIEARQVSEYYRSVFVPSSDRGYDGATFPYYDPAWLRMHAERERQLKRLGVLTAATSA